MTRAKAYEHGRDEEEIKGYTHRVHRTRKTKFPKRKMKEDIKAERARLRRLKTILLHQ